MAVRPHWSVLCLRMDSIDTRERRARLGLRHHLGAGAATVQQAATDLVGLHSSDPVTVYLSCQARVSAFEKADLDRALYDDRNLLRVLGMRRTLFVVPHELAAAVDVGCSRLLYPAERRRLIKYLEDQNVADDGDAWLEAVEDRTLVALADLGEATAKELGEVVPELTTKLSFGAGKSWAGQVGVSTRVLFLLATRGVIIRGRPLGTWLSTQYRWSLLSNWIAGEFEAIDTSAAQAELVRRWLRAYGPGTFNDVKWWTGWGMRVTRAALEAVGAVEVDLEGTVGYALADDLQATAPCEPWAALLPSLDPTVMGWKDRDWYVGNHASRLFDRNGNAGPTVWCNGRVVGGWTVTKGGVRFRLLEKVGSEEKQLINQRAEILEHWLGGNRFTPRFRTPLDQQLDGEAE